MERLQPRAVLLYSSRTLNLLQLPRLLAGVDCPRLLAGPATAIHPDALQELAIAEPPLHLASDPVAAFNLLRELHLLNGETP